MSLKQHRRSAPTTASGWERATSSGQAAWHLDVTSERVHSELRREVEVREQTLEKAAYTATTGGELSADENE